MGILGWDVDKSNNLNKRAFTLFELMIVVIIIGVVYSLVLGTFDPKKSVNITRFENLKDALAPHWTKGVKVDLYIYDRCRKSAIFINDEIKEDVKFELDIGIFKDIKVFKSDRLGDKRKIEFTPVIVEEKLHKVCFNYTIFPNGSTSSFIAKSGKKYYTFFPYFEQTYISTRINDALEHYTKENFTKITVNE